MTTRGFNLQVITEDTKLTITNTLSSGVTFQIAGKNTLTYGYDGVLENVKSEIELTKEDFVKLVDVLKNAQEKVKEQIKKPVIKKAVITEELETKPKKTVKKTATKKKAPTKKKGAKK